MLKYKYTMKKLILATITTILNAVCIGLLLCPDFINVIIKASYTLKHVEVTTTSEYLFSNHLAIFIGLLFLSLVTIFLTIILVFIRNRTISNTVTILGVLSLIISILLLVLFNLYLLSNKIPLESPPAAPGEEIATLTQTHSLGKSGYIYSAILFISSIFTMSFGAKAKR